MKSFEIRFPATRNKYEVIYGSRGTFAVDLEYYLIIVDPEALYEEQIICSIGTLKTWFPHPKDKYKREYTKELMAERWRDAGVPESDVLLMLSGLPV
jgi:hypothetical protein